MSKMLHNKHKLTKRSVLSLPRNKSHSMLKSKVGSPEVKKLLSGYGQMVRVRDLVSGILKSNDDQTNT